MAISTGLVLKVLGGLGTTGVLSTGTWVLVSKNSWTDMDNGVFEDNKQWTWRILPDNGYTNNDTNLEIILSASVGNSSKKTWECKIQGRLKAASSRQVNDQLKELLKALGSTVENIQNDTTTGTFNIGKIDEKPGIKKFLNTCVQNRTWSEWKQSKWGTTAESTISIDLVPVSEGSSNYKFEENKFSSLYK